MRKTERIDEFCGRLANAWKRVPDWRFGQLMMNVLGEMAHSGRDPFFPEEDEMIEYIEKYVGMTSPGEFAHNHPFGMEDQND